MKTQFRTRSLGGSLLVIKGLNDCLTIERNWKGRAEIVRIEGSWTKEEQRDAIKEWYGSDAQRR